MVFRGAFAKLIPLIHFLADDRKIKKNVFKFILKLICFPIAHRIISKSVSTASDKLGNTQIYRVAVYTYSIAYEFMGRHIVSCKLSSS